jgi:hypothetical protein
LYGDVNFKKREINDYDWARFQEELLFQNENTTTFVSPPHQDLDTVLSAPSSSAAVVSNYTYINERTAFKNLVTYSKDHTLILIADWNRLFFDLQQAASSTPQLHISIYDRLYPTILDKNPLRAEMKQIFTKIDKAETPIDEAVPTVMRSDGDNHISIQLSATTSIPFPVVIKNSYFPDWKRTDGQPVYLTSPGFILTYATSSFDLVFTTPREVYLGYAITCLTGIGFIALAYMFRKKKNTQS